MTISNVLIRPQLLERRSSPADENLLIDLVMELGIRVLQDILTEGPAKAKIEVGVQAAIDGIKSEFESNALGASQKVKDWFMPLTTAIEEAMAGEEDENPVINIFKSITALLKILKETVCALHTEDILVKLNTLLDWVEHDLGLTKVRVIQFFNEIINTVTDELTKDYLIGDDTASAKNLFLMGSQIRQIKNIFIKQGGDALPEVSREDFVNTLLNEISDSAWDEIVTKACQFLDKLTDAIAKTQAVFTINTNVDISIEVGSRSIRKDGHEAPIQKSWYATWFFDNAWPTFLQFVKEEEALPDRFALEEAPFGHRISFKDGMDARFMEHWAHVSSGSIDLTEAVMNILSIEKGDIGTNTYNAALQTFKGLFTLLSHDQTGAGWMSAHKWIKVFEFWAALGGTSLTALERYPGSGDGYFYSNFLPDQVEMILNNLITNQFKEFWLSFFTLINSDLDAKPTAENFQKSWGFSFLFMEIGLWGAVLLPKAYHGDRHFGFDPFPPRGWPRFEANFKKTGLYLLTGIGMTYVGGLLGWLIGGAISGKLSEEYWGEKSWGSTRILLLGTIKFALYYYLFWAGRTDGGKLGLDSNDTLVRYKGYPPQESSPYKLPYPSDVLQQCVQGNHDIFSHNLYSKQIYAYDFNHNLRDEILAIRGGTVHYFQDDYVDGTTVDWNGIQILHNDTTEGPIPNPIHDRDHTDVPTLTRAEYGHGAHFGVRHAFALRGVPRQFINGHPIRQGDLILLAGDTGISQFNHLHLHVRPLPEPGPKVVTLPFVFSDAEQKKLLGFIPLGTPGVPRAFDYYDSSNVKTSGPAEAFAKCQPEFEEGTIVSSGVGFIEVDNSVNGKGISGSNLSGAHIFITINTATANRYEYKKNSQLQQIQQYNYNRRRLGWCFASCCWKHFRNWS